MNIEKSDWRTRQRWVMGGLAVFSTVAVFFASLIPYLQGMARPALAIGGVATEDIQAPYTLTYESAVLTAAKRQAVVANLSLVYSDPDTAVARRQLERLRAALTFISNIRADAYATPQQKLADFAALQDLSLNRESIDRILSYSETRWLTLQQETILVLEQLMRGEIRDDRLDAARRQAPALVSLSLPEDQAAVVVEIAGAFLAPNSLYDEARTTALREQAAKAVSPINRSFISGETIIQRGQVVDAATEEALQQFGLIQPQANWKSIASAGLVSLLAMSFFTLYIYRRRYLLRGMRGPVLLTLLFLVFLFGARLSIPDHAILTFIYPVAAFTLTVAVLFNFELAQVATLLLAILVAYNLPRPVELVLYIVLTGYFGSLALQHAERVSSFITAAIWSATAGAVVLAVYRLLEPTTDVLGMLTLMGSALISGVVSAAFSMILQFFLAQWVGLISPLQLIELTRPDHPLLKYMLLNAPGTYQHSLQVANLAEQAAERIGADALLTRVGALYHDAGKAMNPYFFIENQMPGNLNPHDELDPELSSATIVKHVPDGIELARRYRLPRLIHNFILEHHGTMLTGYQYAKAIEAAGGDASKVDAEKFRYPGPRPHSRETALLMLADGCEARMRAERPKDEAALRMMIKDVIDTRIKLGQLDDTELTLRTLSIIIDSFVGTLRGVYHPRIEYPKIGQTQSSPPEKVSPIANWRKRDLNNIQINEEARLPDPLPVELELLERAVVETLLHQGQPADAELTVLLSDDAQLQQLNREFMGVDAPTDVLSFPADLIDPDTGHPYLGDIIISLERAVQQAAENNQSPQDEALLLTVHGVLHLLGHDHAEEHEKAAMWTAQDQILEKLQRA